MNSKKSFFSKLENSNILQIFSTEQKNGWLQSLKYWNAIVILRFIESDDLITSIVVDILYSTLLLLDYSKETEPLLLL
jgi:hypothetical protein